MDTTTDRFTPLALRVRGNEWEEVLDSIAPVFYSALNTLEVIVPGNLTEIEATASRRLDEIMMNVTSTLMTLRNNFRVEI